MEKKYTNKLIKETSPYLLQHAHNPVNWYPWGEEAFKKAEEENKLLIVSIGYSACHWCHVMERECFEDEEVAKVMNEFFVSVKVDREERPDVDNVYMDSLHLMGKQGGWPLNCIALPDGLPVFGGTYFPKETWIQVLEKVYDLYIHEKPKILDFAQQVKKGVERQALIQVEHYQESFDSAGLLKMVKEWKKSMDIHWGGSKGAPKFPMPNGLSFLLQYYYYTNDEDIYRYLKTTLEKMASGGIYDQIGGGFARYSTDSYWRVPHFEKMLYDNAQLVFVYSDGYKLFKEERFKQVVFETLAFIERELKSKSGGFYAAVDADSEGEEGKYYVWTYEELEKVLGDNINLFADFFSCTHSGNWEKGVNVLYNRMPLSELAEREQKNIKEVNEIIEKSSKRLLEERQKRIRPVTDTKIITSWNALVISAYISAYRAFGEPGFLETARITAEHFRSNYVKPSGNVVRVIKKGESRVPGFLDDHTLLSRAFLELYEVTFDEDWLFLAKQIVDYTIENFYNDDTGMFLFNKAEKELFASKTEIMDNVIPSSNSVMANLLYKMYLHFDNQNYFSIAENMLRKVYPNLLEHGSFFSNWALLLNEFVFQPPEVVFTGKNAQKLRDGLDRMFVYANISGTNKESSLPLLKGRFEEMKSKIYVCRNKTCKFPVEDVSEALSLIKRSE